MEHIFGQPQPILPQEPFPSPLHCEFDFDTNNVKSFGFVGSASVFFGGGLGVDYSIMFDIENFPYNFVILKTADIGIGAGGGVSGGVVFSEASLDELTGLSIGGSISYYLYGQYNAAFGTLSCVNSSIGGGGTIGGGATLTLSDTDLVFDSRTGQLSLFSIPLIPDIFEILTGLWGEVLDSR